MYRILTGGLIAGLLGSIVASSASGQVFPDQPHAAYNAIPLGAETCTYHQVYAAAQFGNSPVQIHSLGFAPDPYFNGRGIEIADLVIKIGYTDRNPGYLSFNLSENPRGSMTEVLNLPRFNTIINSQGTEDFSLVFELSTPFCYDPLAGNLLVEIAATNIGSYFGTSRCAGYPDSSRAYNSTVFGNNADRLAQRIEFELTSCSSGPGLRLSGQCPGSINVAWSNATPSRQMGILFARNTGSYLIPGGPCAGAILGLGTNQLQLVNTVGTGSGSGNVNGNAGTAACGGYIQLVVVDGNPCATSNVAQLP